MGFLLFILIVILIFGIGIFASFFQVLKNIFNFGGGRSSKNAEKKENIKRPTKRKKIIDKNEGEYVDFEEMK